METSREFYDRVTSDHRDRRRRRSLRKYCKDEGVDYQCLMPSRKRYLTQVRQEEELRLPGTAERLEARQKYSCPLFDKLMTLLLKIRLSSNKYGTPVMKAVNYILDDEVAFCCFLDDGYVEMHNIAAKRMFRSIAIGRLNRMHVGSHGATEDISFVYSLLESCKLNDLLFGDYIEDICARMISGEKDFESLLPCDYNDSKATGSGQVVA